MMTVIAGRQSAGDEKHWLTGIVPGTLREIRP